MSPDDPNFPWWAKAVAYITLAAFGGLMGSLLRAQHDGKRMKFRDVTLEAGAAGFIGFLFMLMCKELGVSEGWTGVIVGFFGWIGAQASIMVLESFVYKKLGLNKASKDNNVQADQ